MPALHSTRVQNKPAAAGVASPTSVVLVWVAGQFGLDVPPEVAARLHHVAGHARLRPHPCEGVLMLAVLLAARHVSQDDALFWIGVLVVVGCLVGAGVLTFRYAQYVGAVVLLLVAIVAAFLLL